MSNNNTPIEEDLNYLDYCYDTVVDRNKDLERQLEEARESHQLAEESIKFWITKYNELKEKNK